MLDLFNGEVHALHNGRGKVAGIILQSIVFQQILFQKSIKLRILGAVFFCGLLVVAMPLLGGICDQET